MGPLYWLVGAFDCGLDGGIGAAWIRWPICRMESTMRLRRSCQHNRYEEHNTATADFPYHLICPGGAFVDTDVVIRKVDGRWPVEAIGAMAGTYYGLIEQGGLLADIFVAQLDALSRKSE